MELRKTKETDIEMLNLAFNELLEVKDKVEELSGGQIKVDIYPNGQLGALRELIENCQSGIIRSTTVLTHPHITTLIVLHLYTLCIYNVNAFRIIRMSSKNASPLLRII